MLRHITRHALTIILGALLVVAGVVYYQTSTKPAQPTFTDNLAGTLNDHDAYLVYLPQDTDPGKTYPLVFTLSPSADAATMIQTWAPVADGHQWIVAASKEFQNGREYFASLRQLEAALNDVERQYPIDQSRVIFTGISGGGQGALGFAKVYPDRLSAVVVNTGMMAPVFQANDYPQGKLVVFLASPTDFRYEEMKRDRAFLESREWDTHWIEFEGGHILAPAKAYAEAAV